MIATQQQTSANATSGGHIIQENEVSFPQQPKLNFKGNVVVTNNVGNNSTDVEITGNSGVPIVGEVVNYSALPSAAAHLDEVWLVANSQGTRWLPGSLGGTFYPKGLYQSNGTDWDYLGEIPYTFPDNNFQLYNQADNTKRVQFDLSNLTTAITRIFSFPNQNDTIIGATASQTLANKTLNQPLINAAAKGTVDDNDRILISDSADSNASKFVLWSVFKNLLNALFVPRGIVSLFYINNTTVTHTGTLSETIVQAIPIPTSIAPQSILSFSGRLGVTSNANNKTFRFYISTSATSIAGATSLGAGIVSANFGYGAWSRLVWFKNSATNQEIMSPGFGTMQDANMINVPTAIALNFATPRFFLLTCQLANATDICTLYLNQGQLSSQL